jgi:hypothetical protein
MTTTPESMRWSGCLLVILLGAPCAGAAELMPYAPPPSQSAVPMQRPPTQAAAARAAVVTVAPEVYQQFADKVRAFNAAQREDLKRRLERGHDEAVASGDASREFHYHRLLDILSKGL